MRTNRAPRAPETTTCAAFGCQVTINRPLLMCGDHWRMVPSALRRNVWGCFHRLNHEGGQEAASAHLRAVMDAIEAVKAKQLNKKATADESTPPLF